jgi:hypothetical protein
MSIDARLLFVPLLKPKATREVHGMAAGKRGGRGGVGHQSFHNSKNYDENNQQKQRHSHTHMMRR